MASCNCNCDNTNNKKTIAELLDWASNLSDDITRLLYDLFHKTVIGTDQEDLENLKKNLNDITKILNGQPSEKEVNDCENKITEIEKKFKEIWSHYYE